MGATTIWERWDGFTPQRGFQASSMNSFNHYSLGSVGKWLYSGVGGIGIDEDHPGFKHFFLKQRLGFVLVGEQDIHVLVQQMQEFIAEPANTEGVGQR